MNTNKVKNILHYIYCLALLLASMAPGLNQQYSTIIENQSKSRALNSMGEYALFNTDFGLHILQYLSISLILTIGICVVFSKTSLIISKQIKENFHPRLVLIFFPVFSITGLMLIHTKQFPQSTNVYSSLLEVPLFHPVSIIGLFALSLNFIIPLILLFKFSLRFPKRSTAVISIFVVSIFISGFNQHSDLQNPHKNVIMIGIDSLRLDLYKNEMPFLTSLLNDSSVLESAYTPFARTFPAWSTILSGQFPPSTGARFNLIDEKLLNPNTQYLPNILKTQGYKSIYASDERRFSHIGEYHGFDEVLGPRTGLSDFILGRYADQPLTNLLTLLPFSYLLTPELTINRAASTVYEPQTYSQYLSSQLESRLSPDQPLFLATHFCLAHWPFTSKATEYKQAQTDIDLHYLESLSQVDNQIKQLWINLKQAGLVENSIIIFLSDHGESWMEDLEFTSDDSKQYRFNTHGHGDNVLNNNEHSVLMAIYNNKISKPITTNKMSTLADITPTVLDILELDMPDNLHGRSLLTTNSHNLNDFIFPVESGFTVTATSSKDINPEEAAQQAVARYYITKAGQLRIKTEEIPFLSQGKRIGVRNKSQILTYQQPIFDHANKLLLLNLDSMKGKEIQSLKDISNESESKLMQAMCQWYPEKIESLNLCTNQHASIL